MNTATVGDILQLPTGKIEHLHAVVDTVWDPAQTKAGTWVTNGLLRDSEGRIVKFALFDSDRVQNLEPNRLVSIFGGKTIDNVYNGETTRVIQTGYRGIKVGKLLEGSSNGNSGNPGASQGSSGASAAEGVFKPSGRMGLTYPEVSAILHQGAQLGEQIAGSMNSSFPAEASLDFVKEVMIWYANRVVYGNVEIPEAKDEIIGDQEIPYDSSAMDDDIPF